MNETKPSKIDLHIEGQTKEELSYEMVDVLWNLLRLAELKDVDLEKAFMEKWEKNEKRPL